MDNYERLKVILYQYILFKADFYKSVSDELLNRLRTSKQISSDDLHSYYVAKIKSEFFEDFFKEIADILSFFNER